ncbi:MAG: DUF1844 domain-containing protein [Fimbriimonadaceae bacterium]|nr:DUF1844 domain-containing protein [Fimbriimonadaceae bacterium]
MEETQKPLDAYEFAGVMLQQCVEIAWQKIGLRPDPFTGKLEPDRDAATLAIDLADAIFARLRPILDADDVRDMQNVLRDLRLNFVQRFPAGGEGSV